MTSREDAKKKYHVRFKDNFSLDIIAFYQGGSYRQSICYLLEGEHSLTVYIFKKGRHKKVNHTKEFLNLSPKFRKDVTVFLQRFHLALLKGTESNYAIFLI